MTIEGNKEWWDPIQYMLKDTCPKCRKKMMENWVDFMNGILGGKQ